MRCLVSGATGFIGEHLCRYLRDAGDEVLALSGTHGRRAAESSCQPLDLTRDMPSSELLRGNDCVYHLAGVAHRRADTQAYHALNYRATLELAERTRQSGVPRFVFLSSVRAMGAAQDARPRVESDCALPKDDYGLSKWRAECALRDEFADSELSVIILRPTLVYGAGVRGNLFRLARAVRAGLPRPPERGRRSMLAVQDLVELMRLCGAEAPKGIHTWIASGSGDYSTRDLYDALRRGLHTGRSRLWLPAFSWYAGLTVVDALRGREDGLYYRMFGNERYSHAAVSSELGWQPRFSFDDCAEQIVAGLEQSG
ncbi:MAG: NAD-dependent epimerase/dehydratase family protein [Pseudomonadota bacterium]